MKRKRLIIILLILAVLGAVILWDNFRITLTEYEIGSERVEKATRIVQISDYHNCERLGERMIEVVKKMSPQVIVITGDFIDGRSDYHDALDVASELTQIAKTYFVTGNHEIVDLSSDYRDELKERGVVILSGDSVAIGQGIRLYGIEDPMFTGSISADLQRLKPDINEYNVLLSHRPEAFSLYTETDFDLVLTGHAHGGQIRIPFIGGVIAPDQGLLPKYDSGSFEENGTRMIVSRGIGNSILPVRINDPAELVCIDLRPEG